MANNNERRHAFSRTLKGRDDEQQADMQKPLEPLTTIPRTEKKERKDKRKWESEHPGKCYFIPDFLVVDAKNVRKAILRMAQDNMANTSNIAKELMKYALRHVREGKLPLDAQPNPKRRKMTLTLQDADGWPQDTHSPAERVKKPMREETYLNYRLGSDIDRQIEACAGTHLSKGEVVVFLLKYAISAHDNGRATFTAQPVVVKQAVTTSG